MTKPLLPLAGPQPPFEQLVERFAPVEVAWLRGVTSVRDAVAATILDLIRRGVIAVRSDNVLVRGHTATCSTAEMYFCEAVIRPFPLRRYSHGSVVGPARAALRERLLELGWTWVWSQPAPTMQKRTAAILGSGVAFSFTALKSFGFGILAGACGGAVARAWNEGSPQASLVPPGPESSQDVIAAAVVQFRSGEALAGPMPYALVVPYALVLGVPLDVDLNVRFAAATAAERDAERARRFALERLVNSLVLALALEPQPSSG